MKEKFSKVIKYNDYFVIAEVDEDEVIEIVYIFGNDFPANSYELNSDMHNNYFRGEKLSHMIETLSNNPNLEI